MTEQTVTTEKMKKKKKRRIGTKRQLQLYSLAAIPVLLVFVFKYLPMFGIIIGFKDYRYDKGILGSEWVGFKNFEFFFKSSDFVRITRNTLVMNFIFIFVGLVASVGLAILLYELKSRNKTKVYQTIFITPHFISWVVISYMVYAFLEPTNGFINTFLENIGLEKISWYTEAKYWPVILTIFNVWKKVGMDCVVYYAALMGIDASLFEAAEIDGANKWQRTLHIVVPCLVPLMVILTIMSIGGIFHSDFGLFYQVPRNVSKLYPTTDVIDTYVFRTLRVIGDMGLGSAVGLVQSLIGFILVITTNYISKKVDSNLGLM